FKRLLKISGYYLFIGYLALWWIFVHLVNEGLPVYFLLGITLTVNSALLVYLFATRKIVFTNFHKYIIALFYIGGGCIFLTMIPYRQDGFAQYLIMGVFILIWVNDTFAYVVGRTLGRHKLFPSISPNKTIEGALGGVIFALIAAYLMSRFEPILSTVQWLSLAAVIVVTGNLGDLLESKFKRVAGVKDSGAIFPGHGGVLDRLDSLVFAAPFAYLMLILYTHVP
ncbi:MAG: phosphatidate cytidylyltransferase, partial [Bacteroidota bacterium]